MYRNNLLACLTLALSVSVIPVKQAVAQTYLGEVCWEVVDTVGQGLGTTYAKLAVQEIGDNHYSLSGRVIIPALEPQEIPELLNGSGQLLGDDVFITLSGAKRSIDGFGTTTYMVKLAADTLDGAYVGIGRFYSQDTNEFYDEHSEGRVTRSDCPVWEEQSEDQL